MVSFTDFNQVSMIEFRQIALGIAGFVSLLHKPPPFSRTRDMAATFGAL